MMLKNKVNQTKCIDDGIAVKFLLLNANRTHTLSAGQTGVRRVLHCYGDVRGEFEKIPVINPSVSNTDYTYQTGFIIPAGDYSTPKELTLDNIQILDNTVCNADKTFNIKISSDGCNDLLNIIGATTTVTIEDDENLSLTRPNDQIHCSGDTVPVTVFSTNLPSSITWEVTSGSAASIGLPDTQGNGNLPTFIAHNSTTSDQTVTINVKASSGDPNTSRCDASQSFTITVLPTPFVDKISDIEVCNGCTDTKSFTITVYPTPVVTISANPGFFLCEKDAPSITFKAHSVNGGGSVTYTWKKDSVVVGNSSDTYVLNLDGVRKANISCTIAASVRFAGNDHGRKNLPDKFLHNSGQSASERQNQVK
jgi:hypothetical protein